MEEIIDLIATDGSVYDASNKIKDFLYTKAASRVDSVRPYVAALLFGDEYSGENE